MYVGYGGFSRCTAFRPRPRPPQKRRMTGILSSSPPPSCTSSPCKLRHTVAVIRAAHLRMLSRIKVIISTECCFLATLAKNQGGRFRFKVSIVQATVFCDFQPCFPFENSHAACENPFFLFPPLEPTEALWASLRAAPANKGCSERMDALTKC